jgi:phospholipase D-like protein
VLGAPGHPSQDASSGTSIVGLILPIMMVVALGGWVWAIANIAHYSGTEWDASGQSAVVWVVILIFLPLLGLILYLTVARPKLKSSVLR